MQNPSLLFVYGTLRKGSNHAMARRLAAEAQWIGRAMTAGRLYIVADYPALVLNSDSDMVAGDLFRLHDPVTSLAWLDAYEGCGPGDPLPHEYKRIAVQVTGVDRVMHTAQTYVWNKPLAGLLAAGSGDWLTEIASMSGALRRGEQQGR